MIKYEDKKDCFARIDRNKCNALIERQCNGCRFYKHREKIRNNPYYAYSFKNKEEHLKMMKKYKILDEQVVWK